MPRLSLIYIHGLDLILGKIWAKKCCITTCIRILPLIKNDVKKTALPATGIVFFFPFAASK